MRFCEGSTSELITRLSAFTMNEETWDYSSMREELYCPHGVGHPVPWSDKETHGCDGCCSEEEFQNQVEKLKEDLDE